MKIYIGVDFEGMPYVNSWDEVDASKPESVLTRKIATEHVIAACEGALEGGATEVWVSDSHWTSRNLDPTKMPKGVKLVRGDVPFGAFFPFLDKTFDGVALVGQHSEWGSGENPLCHTYNDVTIDFVKINGVVQSETDYSTKFAAYYGIPTILVAGDEGVTKNYKNLARTVTTTKGIGGATVMIKTIDECNAELKSEMKKAVEQIKSAKAVPLDKKFELQIKYRFHKDAYKNAFYPNASKVDDQTVKVVCENYYEVMRALSFMLGTI